ncbi:MULTISPECIES: amidohydrolase family protein [unclassified Mycobacterium]|uniref:amidohydrolase family protein n=1 Tax=unclassified Mycobacterium TaxID=2642494 RepID=UPI0029C6CCF7|nr:MULTISPECIES: amidohydrolase family protein [unclassified Mycobacterium]
MIEDAFVIDAVAHAFDLRPETYRDPMAEQAADVIYYGLHQGFQARGAAKWTLDRERFLAAATDPGLVGHALFAESPTDMCIYHAINVHGLYANGLSPLSAGLALRERYPGRVLIFGGLSPWQENALDEIDRLAEVGAVGLKIYPHDIVDGKILEFRLDDPEAAYPLIERARAHGIRTIALQKSQPIGPVPLAPYSPADVEGAAMAFPDMTFELVHGGWAFLEETASQLARFPNVTINLEITTAYLLKAPRRFAEILGTLLASGGRDRLVWATGAMLFHPRPLVEAFWNFEMPRDLVEGYGFPELTREDKIAILGRNQARILGLDIAKLQTAFAGDPAGGDQGTAEPWTGGRPVAELEAVR